MGPHGGWRALDLNHSDYSALEKTGDGWRGRTRAKLLLPSTASCLFLQSFIFPPKMVSQLSVHGLREGPLSTGGTGPPGILGG